MAQIQVLDPHLAAKIAAGEVIERPASVVKELVENAVDAGATWIRVEVDGGGLARIAVADDGCGIGADQVDLAFLRHATSKLRTEDDLARLHTLGFRGEALPSIAAVADVTLATRAVDERVGIAYRIDSGAVETEPVGRQVGTSVEVRDLFGRFPARRKFMRSRAVEAAQCVSTVAPLALAYPSIRFTVLVDGREALRTPGDTRLQSAAIAVLGRESASHLLPVVQPDEGTWGGDPPISIAGLVATGAYTRSNRSGLYLLLNGRPIQNRSLAFAVVEAYGSLLQVGRQPVVVLDIRVPPEEVDINVHPSKLEVKLLRERAVYAAVQQAVRATLGAGGWGIPELAQAAGAAARAAPHDPENVSFWESHVPPAESGPGSEDLLSGGVRLEDLHVVGQVGRTYVVAEGDAGLYLVDQHAAHERVLLEQLRQSLAGRADRQLLLEPLLVELPPDAAALAGHAAADLAALGFEADSFGPRQILLRAVPAVVADRQPGRVVSEALAALAHNEHGLQMEPTATWPERLALVLACKTAIRAGDTLDRAEMQALLRQLGEAEICRTCAHGRPTAILLSHAHLEREFGRR